MFHLLSIQLLIKTSTGVRELAKDSSASHKSPLVDEER